MGQTTSNYDWLQETTSYFMWLPVTKSKYGSDYEWVQVITID